MPKTRFDGDANEEIRSSLRSEWEPYDPKVWRPHAGHDASYALLRDMSLADGASHSYIVKIWRAERVPGPPIVEPAE